MENSTMTGTYFNDSTLQRLYFCLNSLDVRIDDSLTLVPASNIVMMTSICDEIWTVKRVTFFMAQAIGLPGNILTFLIMLQFPRTTATFYLALLAVSDWMALVTKATNVLMLTFRTFDDWSCKVILTLTNFTAIYANWVLVLICFERLVTIVIPLKKSYYFTLKRAHVSALMLAAIIFLFCSVYLWKVVAREVCETLCQEFSSKWSYVEHTLYSYLPSILMLIMVLITRMSLKKTQKERKIIYCGDSGPSSNLFTKQRLRGQAKMENSITMMLLFAAVTFLVLTLPLCVMITVVVSIDDELPILNRLYIELAYFIAIGLAHMSHAVNVFIYFVSSESFRAHFVNLLKCSRFKKKKQQNTQDLIKRSDLGDQL